MPVKKMYIGFILFLILCIVFTISYASWCSYASSDGLPEQPDVIIDPGHGGVDGGAVSKSGVVEKDVNLAIALQLRDILKSEGYTVMMTRTEDVSIHDPSAKTIRAQKTSDLKNRLALINSCPDSVFVSIHQNSLPDSSVTGTLFYYGGKNPASQVLANMLKQQILTIQPENNKVIKKAQSNLFLLTNAQGPSVLVECGFLSNAGEAQMLASPKYQQELSQLIAQGLEQFLKAQMQEEQMEQGVQQDQSP